MNSYGALAGAYDALTTDVRYLRRADFLERLFRKSLIPVHTVLDLACGTGTLSCLLAERGYGVTAVDASEDMLAVAQQKAEGLVSPPLFLHQSMPRLRLLEPVDAVICTLDAINYLTKPADVQRTFERVSRWLKPGGQFIFDINSVQKLRRMDGQMYLDETDDIYCVWRTRYSSRTRIATYWVDLFQKRKDGTWERSCEEHRERAYEIDELTGYLRAAGFDRIFVTGDLRSAPPRADEDRVIFRCIRGKQEIKP